MPLPAEPPEARCQIATERGMSLVEQPIEGTAPPTDDEVEVRVQGGNHPPDSGEPNGRRPAALDVGDRLLADAGTRRQIGLAPAKAMPKRADGSA